MMSCIAWSSCEGQQQTAEGQHFGIRQAHEEECVLERTDWFTSNWGCRETVNVDDSVMLAGNVWYVERAECVGRVVSLGLVRPKLGCKAQLADVIKEALTLPGCEGEVRDDMVAKGIRIKISGHEIKKEVMSGLEHSMKMVTICLDTAIPMEAGWLIRSGGEEYLIHEIVNPPAPKSLQVVTAREL